MQSISGPTFENEKTVFMYVWDSSAVCIYTHIELGIISEKFDQMDNKLGIISEKFDQMYNRLCIIS